MGDSDQSVAARSADLLKRAAARLRDPYRCNNDPAVDAALADWLDKAAEVVAGYSSEWADRAESLFPECFAVARAILREVPDA